MADNEMLDQQNVVNLTKATLTSALLQIERERLRIDQQELLAQRALVKDGTARAQQLDKEITKNKELLAQQRKIIATSEQEIQTRRDAIVVNGKTLKGIEAEVKAKEALQKEYLRDVDLIRKSGLSAGKARKAIKNLQKQMEQRFGGKKFLPEEKTFVSVARNVFKGDFAAATETFSELGVSGLLKNTIKAFGGIGIAAGLLFKGARAFHDNIILPSARMQNLAGQQLGIAAGSRNLWGGGWINSWAGRTLLGYSAQEQQNLYSSLIDAIRENPNAPGGRAAYENALTGMMAVQKLWGTDTGTLSKFYKAFYQTGTSSGQLSERFNSLMRSVEGTGWTTSEYADTLGKNIMYLKNFGVNLDTYSKDLLKYGQAIRQEKLSAEDIAPKMRGEASQEMAMVAQKMLESGIISAKTLGAGLSDNIFKQAGALRAYAAVNPQAYRQKVMKLWHTDPQMRSMLESAGVAGDKTAEWEFMTRMGGPGMAALADFSAAQKGPKTWYDAVTGKLESTPSTGLGVTDTQNQIVSDAMTNVARTTTGLKQLMLHIADLITNFAGTLETQPADFQQRS